MDHARDGVAWLLAAGMVLAGVFFVYPLFLGNALVDPDEGLHASIAQEMVERGDWVTPRFLGEPFFDKPVLFSWTQALSLRIFGMTEGAARVAGMFYGLLGMLTTGLVGWRLFGRIVGAAAAMIYASSVYPLALTQVAAHDVALIPWINLAILLFWEADRAATRAGQAACTLAIGLCLGLACLTKGLVGVAIVGVAYGSYLLVTRRWTVAACVRGAGALTVAGLVASAWYLAMESRHPGYLHYYFVERHLLGYATDSQKHAGKPFWFYFPILLWGGLPWITYLPVGLREWWLRRQEIRPSTAPTPPDNGGLTLVLCWLVSGTLLMTTANSKLITYIWPVFPSLAILLAVAWGRMIEGRLTDSARQWLANNFRFSCLSGPIFLPVSLALAQLLLDVRFSWLAWTLAVAAGLSCWVPLVLWRKGRTAQAFAVGGLTLGAQFAVVMALIAPPAARVHSALDLAQYFNQRGRLPSRLVLVEDRVGSLVFYLDPALRAGLRKEQIEAIRAREVPSTTVHEPDAMIVVADQEVDEAQPYLDLTRAVGRRAGRFRLYSASEWRTMRVATAACPNSDHCY